MTTQRMDRALERFRQGEAALYDGEKRLWSDEEHERRYDAFLAEFDEEKDSAIAEADREIERAERTLALEHRDLSDSLTNEELERANAKRSYIEDDVWSLDLETLLKRGKAAQVGGDKPTMFLLRPHPREARRDGIRGGECKRANRWSRAGARGARRHPYPNRPGTGARAGPRAGEESKAGCD